VLKLRRGVVVATAPLTVEVTGERRPAWADPALIGAVEEGDEVIVNVEAFDLGLGSGGFDIVHANLTRGLEGGDEAGAHVFKLNYTPIQHPVEPVERGEELELSRRPIPVLVIPLHGHLAPAVWAAAELDQGLRVGFVQTAGGALPGTLSRDVAELRRRGLLREHVTVAPAYGGEAEAISVVGALDAAATTLDWGAAIVGPGPGMLGSASHYGHGGMAALDSAHAALSLGLPTLLGPRLSAADPRARHRGLSHHTASVLDLLLGGVEVPLPGDFEEIAPVQASLPDPHQARPQPVDLDGYAASGLSTEVMGRGLDEDRLFFAAALASGRALAEVARSGPGEG
jgi:Protein of unknown function (DUF3866)